MSFEEDLPELLNPLVGGEVFWDTTPDGYLIQDDKPFLIIQQIGGRDNWYVDQSLPSHKHARIQVTAHSRRRITTNALARAVERRIAEGGMIAQSFGAFTGSYDEQMKLYTALQQYGFWYPDAT